MMETGVCAERVGQRRVHLGQAHVQTRGGVAVHLQHLLLADAVEAGADVAELLHAAHHPRQLQGGLLQWRAVQAVELERILSLAATTAAATAE